MKIRKLFFGEGFFYFFKVGFITFAGFFLFWITLVPFYAISSNLSQLNSEASKETIADYSGEKLIYDISFLWFKNAAEGSIALQNDDQGYLAKLKAETKGFIGFFTGYVKHFYVSHMKKVGEKNGLLPYLFEKKIIYQEKEENVVTSLDYDNRIMSWTKTKTGENSEKKSAIIPNSITYYDILSVFYNFRTGYYGDVQKGKDFIIHVIPEKNESKINIHVSTEEEELKFKKEEYIEDSEGYFLVIKIPKEIFKTKKGEVLIWGNENLLPLKVIVRDYIGFGDVVGTLREATDFAKE